MNDAALPVEQIRAAAESRRDLVVALQRDLHQIPELSLQEVQTTRYVAAFLRERGISFDPMGLDTGGVAVVGEQGPWVLLRADMDALPVHEAHDHAHRSRHDGCMHACGHDAHTAMLLAAVDALASGEIPLPGRVVCLFQPAEERGGGCERLLRKGLLARYPVRAAVALHVWPQLASGAVALAPGPVMASMDSFRLSFQGRGGHGAYPHACVDPVVMAAEAVLALQTLVSRRVDPLHPAVVTIGQIHGGTAGNIIPEQVELEGTLRAFTDPVRRILMDGVCELANGVAEAHGGQCSCGFHGGYPVTCNDPEATRTLRSALETVLGAAAVVPGDRTMGSEDMSFLLEQVPGCYLKLGASPDPESAAPLHSPAFHVDPACLPVGVSTLLTAALALLE